VYGSCIPRDKTTLRENVLLCINDITLWMTSNRLKLNPTKTEFMLCATSNMQRLVDRAPFIVQGVSISPSPSVRLLGVLIDSELTLTDQVSFTVSSCFYQLRRLRSVRCSIPLEAVKSVVNAFVISWHILTQMIHRCTEAVFRGIRQHCETMSSRALMTLRSG